MAEALQRLRRPAPVAGRRTATITALAAVPGELRVANATTAEAMGVTEAWIMKRTGVLERRVAPADLPLWALAADAGRRALERAGVAAADVDRIIVATCTHDQVMPAAAALVAAELGAPHAAAMDVNSVCNGFIVALEMGSAAIEAQRADRVLVIGADVLSRWTDPADPRTAPVFGDGAGAVLLSPAGVDGDGAIGAAVVGGDASGAHLIRCARDGTMQMAGQETYLKAVTRMTQVTEDVLDRAGLGTADIDLFVYHQANARILRAVGERLALDPDRVVNSITRTGNTSAASIPLALAHAAEDGRLVSGTRVLVCGFGSGLSFGAMIIDWQAAS